jgi:hypothetical protein
LTGHMKDRYYKTPEKFENISPGETDNQEELW